MFRTKVAAKAVARNAVAVVSAALLPGAVVRLPVPCPMLLPGGLLNALLLLALPRGCGTPLLPGVFLRPADRWPLLLRSLSLSPLR